MPNSKEKERFTGDGAPIPPAPKSFEGQTKGSTNKDKSSTIDTPSAPSKAQPSGTDDGKKT